MTVHGSVHTHSPKLNGEGSERNFDIISAFACSTLGRLMRDNDFYTKHPNRTIFALFDWDKAYNDWNDGGSDLVEPDPANCLARKRKNQTGYNLMLPVPPQLSCRNQVVDPAGDHFADNASLPIELLFIDTPSLEQYFVVDNKRPGNCMKFEGNKMTFAKEIVPALPVQAFENFRPVFDFIVPDRGYVKPTALAGWACGTGHVDWSYGIIQTR